MNIKPKLRKEAELDLESALRGSLGHILKTDIFPFQNCLSCVNFNETKELCKKWNAKPPARVIAFGCDQYEDVDEIPF